MLAKFVRLKGYVEGLIERIRCLAVRFQICCCYCRGVQTVHSARACGSIDRWRLVRDVLLDAALGAISTMCCCG